ncbi:MAG: protease modulator HflC [bacterium]|nr:protease modulator HflC [bacterium]
MRIPIALIWIAVLAIAGLIVFSSSAYVVPETGQAIITRFGRPVGRPITEAGLHFKAPFIDDVNALEKRALQWDGDPNQLPTKDKLFIYVDTYARWRISDPLLFLQRLRNEKSAQTRIDDILDGITRDMIASHELLEIVRSVNREAIKDETLSEMDAVGTLQPIKVGRAKIAKQIHDKASSQLKDLGIELLDIRFKRINYNEDVQKKIYERMISERNQIAEKYRSEGAGEAARILGDKERILQEVKSEAYRKVEEIKGKAEAQATSIYARAYNQSPEASEFYQFIKTLDTYQKVFDKDTTVLLGTGGDFFKYLQRTGMEEKESVPPAGPPAAAAASAPVEASGTP